MSSNMYLFFAMKNNNHLHWKAMCQILKLGQKPRLSYYMAHGSTMYVEGSKVEDKLVVFRCPYCCHIICMSIINKLSNT
jgi:hypothetical protein